MNDEQRNVHIELIDEPPLAMRTEIDPEAIRSLAESIRTDGLINPITVRPIEARFQVVAGHRRLLACRQAPLYQVPCVIRNLTDEQVFNVMSAENLAREDVNPVDQAIHIARLIGDDDARIPDVAKRLHYSEEWVRGRLAILEYPEELLPHIANGTIKLGVAQHLAGINSAFWREQYIKQAVTQGMSVIQARYVHDQAAMGLMPDPADIPDSSDISGTHTPRLMRSRCEKCGGEAVEPNLTLVYIHRECPQDPTPAPAQ
jgi:ParB family chromosome partitioning protein